MKEAGALLRPLFAWRAFFTYQGDKASDVFLTNMRIEWHRAAGIVSLSYEHTTEEEERMPSSVSGFALKHTTRRTQLSLGTQRLGRSQEIQRLLVSAEASSLETSWAFVTQPCSADTAPGSPEVPRRKP